MFKGFDRGLQLIAEFQAMLWRAEKAGNEACVNALLEVMRQWHLEATGSAIEVKHFSVQKGITAFLFGRDPFQGSRQMFAAVKLRFPGV